MLSKILIGLVVYFAIVLALSKFAGMNSRTACEEMPDVEYYLAAYRAARRRVLAKRRRFINYAIKQRLDAVRLELF